MSDQEHDDFEIRPAPPRTRRDPSGLRFAARVRQAAGQSPPGHRQRAVQGRGQGAGHRAGWAGSANARRVIVKTRLVRHSAASRQATAMHLKYIERDGVGPDKEPGRAYGPETDAADLKDFRERIAHDRHHFRFIVSPEEGAALGDLRPYIRQFMRTVERDLGTRTDWIAVDHWNTDNPHSHIVLRGRDARGRDLVIAPDYIARGMRSRAAELATQWLGSRTEWEIRATLQRATQQERWTALDQALQSRQLGDTIHVPKLPTPATPDVMLHTRMQTLERLGLAAPNGAECWSMRPDWEDTLRRLGERGDIIRTMQRAMGQAHRELVIFDGDRQREAVVGRVAGKGLSDELNDRAFLAVDGVDGRAHYVALPINQPLDDYPLGAVVEVRAGGVRAIDTAITRQAEEGIYRAQGVQDADRRVAQVRRLEALRRMGLVERMSEGLWRIPADLPERARRHEAVQLGGAAVTLRSHLPIDQQARAIGATWLDQQLVAKSGFTGAAGFAADVQDALERRRQFLLEEGLATRKGPRLIVARNLLATLRQRELVEAAQRIQAETGLPHRPVFDGNRVTGTYRRALQLVSGRYALIDDGSGFSLVPWRPVIDTHVGQSLSVTVIGQRTSWTFHAQRELSR